MQIGKSTKEDNLDAKIDREAFNSGIKPNNPK